MPWVDAVNPPTDCLVRQAVVALSVSMGGEATAVCGGDNISVGRISRGRFFSGFNFERYYQIL